MVTLGHCDPSEVGLKLRDLPDADILKVKLGSAQDGPVLREVMRQDDRPLLLDGNQGMMDVAAVVRLVELAGRDRVVAVEQPFATHDLASHAELGLRIPMPVIADESLQGVHDLHRVASSFGGINIKLMKCGGLDRAQALAIAARRSGLMVMLGSMSESSLGCATMATLAPLADLLDLDGPWLIGNDPFAGLSMGMGKISARGEYGFGVELCRTLDWSPIGA